MPSASASGADASSSSARNRQHNQGNQDRTYTAEQKQAVVRIRGCKATAFYEILELQRTCTDAEVKKAYRKQSLLTHPDKNSYEHADEAFKMVARAFSVLGDKEKRDKFDRFGTDPDTRFPTGAAPQQNPFAGFANRGGGGGGMGGGGAGGMFGEDISPEELFARFFGGGFGGGLDTGPGFVFNLNGGPNFRVHQFQGGRPRARPRNPGQPEEASLFSTLMGVLPILLLFIFPLLSSLFSGSSPAVAPSMTFDAPHAPYTQERTMPNFGVKYYLNPKDVNTYNDHKLHALDKKAEVILVQRLRVMCEDENSHKQKLREEAQGWFYQDPDKMEVANSMDMPSCRRLKSLHV